MTPLNLLMNKKTSNSKKQREYFFQMQDSVTITLIKEKNAYTCYSYEIHNQYTNMWVSLPRYSNRAHPSSNYFT